MAKSIEVLDLLFVLLFATRRRARSKDVLFAVTVLEVVGVRAATAVLVGSPAAHGDGDLLGTRSGSDWSVMRLRGR